MNFKKKLKAFFTLDRHANGGFTLIELIVVIAIMAILAGVGTAGYGAYVTAANKNSDRVLVGKIRQALETYNNSSVGAFAVEGQYSDGLQLPVGYVVVRHEDDVSLVVDEENEKGRIEMDKAMKAAFGNDYMTTIRLKSDDWDGTVNGAFFENAAGMVDKIDQTGGDVLGLMDKLGNINIVLLKITESNGALTIKPLGGSSKTVQILSQGYEDSAELLLAVAGKVAETDKSTFVDAWDSVDEIPDAFGMEDAGREHYSAVRAAYNNCFANYVKSYNDTFTLNGVTYSHESGSHATGVSNHGDDAVTILGDEIGVDNLGNFITSGVTFPQAISDAALAGGNGSSYTSCDACKALLAEYKSSEQDKQDAESFYDTMTTGAADGAAYYDPADPGALYKWIKDSATTFADMYQEVNALTANGSAVAIGVYYDGTTTLLNVTTSPADADPRND